MVFVIQIHKRKSIEGLFTRILPDLPLNYLVYLSAREEFFRLFSIVYVRNGLGHTLCPASLHFKPEKVGVSCVFR